MNRAIPGALFSDDPADASYVSLGDILSLSFYWDRRFPELVGQISKRFYKTWYSWIAYVTGIATTDGHFMRQYVAENNLEWLY